METFLQDVNNLSKDASDQDRASLKVQLFKFFDIYALQGGRSKRVKSAKNSTKNRKQIKTQKTIKKRKLRKGGTSSLGSSSSNSETIYDIVENIAKSQDKHLDKLPEFYKYFLSNPGKYEEIFKAVNKLRFTEEDVYDDLNIISLMCFATFHIGKFYISINVQSENYKLNETKYENAKKQVAKFYHMPLQGWFDYIIVANNEALEFKQDHDQSYHNAYQYLLLMSYISEKLPFHHRPIVAYLKAIDKQYHNIFHHDVFNLVDDMLEFIVDNIDDEDAYTDEYRSNTRTQCIYDTKDKNYVTDYDIIDISKFGDEKQNIFFNYDIEKWLDTFSNINERDEEYAKIQKEYESVTMNYLNETTLDIFTYVQYATNQLIICDLDQNDPNKLQTNDKLYKTYDAIIKKFINSTDLQKDFVWLFQYQHMVITKSILMLYANEQSIWKFWLKNTALNENSKYFKQLVLAYITGNFDKVISPIFTRYWKQNAENKGIHRILHLDPKNENCLVYLLQRLFGSNTGAQNDLPSFNTEKGIFKDYGLTYRSVDTANSPSTRDPVQANFKNIIHNILKLTTKHMQLYYEEDIVREYYKTIYKYKQALQDELGIDLNKYKFSIISESPESIRQMGSVNASFNNSVVPALNSNHNDLFNGFTDTAFMNKLIKIYTRTVEGVVKDPNATFAETDDKSKVKNGIQRISRIRRYLAKHYITIQQFQETTSIQDVVPGSEAEILYNSWLLGNKPTLNRYFNIKYINAPVTIDAGGPTRQFFTNISKQIQSMYFKVFDEQTGVWIFKDNITKAQAEFIGQLLGVFITLNISLPFALSKLYTAHLMFKREHISKDQLYLYYLLDINANSRKNFLDQCKTELGKRKDVSFLDDDYCNAVNVFNDYIVDAYKYTEDVMDAFSGGFFIEKKIFYSKFSNIDDKIRLYDLNKIISQTKITKYALLKQIFNKFDKEVYIKYGAVYEDREQILSTDPRAQVYLYFKDLMVSDKKIDFEKMYENFVGTLEDPQLVEESKKYKENQKFKEAVLLFWSGINNISFIHSYKIVINPAIHYPQAGTCATEMVLPEASSSNISSKQALYNTFMVLFARGYQNNFGLA
jgi:hypothetical protein